MVPFDMSGVLFAASSSGAGSCKTSIKRRNGALSLQKENKQ